jgi:hypothetical protein
MNFLKNKNVMGGIVAVVLLALVYYIWNSSSSTELLTAEEGTSPLSQELLTTLSQLHTLRLDPAVFKDPVFTSLNDFGATIPPQQAGRRNPFAPVGSQTAPKPDTPAASE